MASRQAAKSGSSKSKSMVIYTLIIIAVVVALFFINQASQKKDEAPVLNDAPPIAGQPTLGNADAKVTIVEFGDYKCPSCKAWGETVWPKLKQDYIDTGKANFAYINVLFHGEESRLSAQAGEAFHKAYPEQFWEFHKKLYDAQPNSSSHNDLWVTEDKLVEIAESVVPALDKEEFIASLSSEYATGMVQLDELLYRQYGVKATPTIAINDIEIKDPFDYEAIKRAIDGQLE